jgi:hypothetical protein
MKAFKLLLIVMAVGLISACSSPEKKAYNAQAKSADYQSKIAQDQ